MIRETGEENPASITVLPGYWDTPKAAPPERAPSQVQLYWGWKIDFSNLLQPCVKQQTTEQINSKVQGWGNQEKG